MTLQGSQLVVLLTKPDAASGYVADQLDPAASLGGYASRTAVASGSSNNCFDAVTQAGVTSGQTDYRCVAIANTSGVDTAQNAMAYLADAAGGGVYTLGLDPAGVKDLTLASQQGTLIVSPFTAPVGVTFGAGPLTVGNLPPNTCQLVWLKCVVTPGTPGTGADAADLTVQAETQ